MSDFPFSCCGFFLSQQVQFYLQEFPIRLKGGIYFLLEALKRLWRCATIWFTPMQPSTGPAPHLHLYTQSLHCMGSVFVVMLEGWFHGRIILALQWLVGYLKASAS